MKVEPGSLPTDLLEWRANYRRLREPAEAVLACSIDLLYHLARLRTLLPVPVVESMNSLRETLDGLEVTLYPHLLARSESEAVDRASETDAFIRRAAEPE